MKNKIREMRESEMRESEMRKIKYENLKCENLKYENLKYENLKYENLKYENMKYAKCDQEGSGLSSLLPSLARGPHHLDTSKAKSKWGKVHLSCGSVAAPRFGCPLECERYQEQRVV